MTTAVVPRPHVLADVIGGGAVRDVALIVAVAAFTGAAAQVAIPLPFTPVPLSLQTFAVLLSAAALGPWRAGAAMGLYLVVGLAGVPWFSEQRAGFAFPSFGYIIGFVAAALIVGTLARHGADRRAGSAVLTMVVGNLAIYAVGVPYLAVAIGVSLQEAIALGLLPFVIGDGLKIVLAAGLLPAAWRLVDRR